MSNYLQGNFTCLRDIALYSIYCLFTVFVFVLEQNILAPNAKVTVFPCVKVSLPIRMIQVWQGSSKGLQGDLPRRVRDALHIYLMYLGWLGRYVCIFD